MGNEPDIVKILKEEEKLGRLQSQSQSSYKDLHIVEESLEGTFDKTIHKIEDTIKPTGEDIELENVGETYRTIFENYAVAITLADEKERIISWNKYAEELFNMAEEDLYLKPASSLYPPEEWERIRAENVRKKGIKYRMETKMIRKNQEPFDVELSLCVLKSAKGKISGSVGIIKDIIKLKKMEKDFKKSGKKFKQLYEKAPVPYHTLSPDGKIINVNETWCQTLHYSKDEVIGKSIFDFVADDEKKHAKTSFEKKIQSKKPYSIANERTYVTKNGKKRIFTIHDFFSFDEENNVSSIYTIMDDVTELKRAEGELKKHQEQLEKLVEERTEELKNSESRLSVIFQFAPDAIFLMNMKGEFVDFNKAAKDLIGYNVEEIAGKKFSEVGFVTSVQSKHVLSNLVQVVRGKTIGPNEYIFTSRDGTRKNTEVIAHAVKIEGKRFILGIARDITDRKKAEEKIKESEEKLRSLVETTSDWIWEVDKNGIYTYASPKIKDLLGYEPGEVIGKTPFDFMTQDETERIGKAFHSIVESKEPIVALVNVNLHKDGRCVVLETSGVPILDASGNLLGYRGVDRDITERKKAEQEIKYLKEYNENILESNPNPMVVIKGNQIEYVNKSFISIFGKTKNDYISKDLKEVIPGEIIPVFEELLQDYDKMKELEIKGKSFSVSSFVVKKAEEEIRRGIILQDITEHKKAEDDIKESEGKFRTFVDTASDLMSITDKDGNFTDLNEAMAKTLGYSKEELIGMRIPQILTKESLEKDLKPNWRKFVTNGEITIETTFVTKNGKEICGELKAVAIYDSDSKFAGGRTVFHDLTDRRKAEETLKKSHKKIEQQNIQLKKLDRIKSDFLNVTSHELRTPMSAIKGYTQMVLKQTLGEVTKEQQNALKVVLRNTNRLDNLIQDILDISRLESGTMKFIPEQTDLEKMVKEAVETMQSVADLKEIKINTDLENLPELIIDQERVKQVIINIVNNAIKFSPDGSIINVNAKKKENDILFEIQDFGKGIPNNKQKKIFDTFYQVDSGMDRKFGGAGLGLAISRGIVFSHGGEIWVESEMGEGSTFRFTLPFKPVQDLEGKFREADIFGLEDSKEDTENS